MHTKKQHCIFFYALPGLLILLFTFSSVNSAKAQRTGTNKPITVLLLKDARANGYKIIEQNGEVFFEAVKVTDPKTKKLIEGLHQLLYRCSQNGPQVPVPLTFNRGKSERVKIACLILIEPKILLADEAVPGQ
ncbi:MAG TPA: hypothetical protein PKI55_12600 [Chitinophagaceae bacterium]|nr:hypothetical protein [Chitinophagaceae bacterium]